LLVEVNGGGGVGNEGRRIVGDTPEIDRAASRHCRVVGEARNEAREFLDGVEVRPLELLLAYGLDFLRYVEQSFLALARGHDHRIEASRLRLVLGERGRSIAACQRDRDRVCDGVDSQRVARNSSS
jgi:hypothetical protein